MDNNWTKPKFQKLERISKTFQEIVDLEFEKDKRKLDKIKLILELKKKKKDELEKTNP